MVDSNVRLEASARNMIRLDGEGQSLLRTGHFDDGTSGPLMTHSSEANEISIQYINDSALVSKLRLPSSDERPVELASVANIGVDPDYFAAGGTSNDGGIIGSPATDQNASKLDLPNVVSLASIDNSQSQPQTSFGSPPNSSNFESANQLLKSGRITTTTDNRSANSMQKAHEKSPTNSNQSSL